MFPYHGDLLHTIVAHAILQTLVACNVAWHRAFPSVWSAPLVTTILYVQISLYVQCLLLLPLSLHAISFLKYIGFDKILELRLLQAQRLLSRTIIHFLPRLISSKLHSIYSFLISIISIPWSSRSLMNPVQLLRLYQSFLLQSTSITPQHSAQSHQLRPTHHAIRKSYHRESQLPASYNRASVPQGQPVHSFPDSGSTPVTPQSNSMDCAQSPSRHRSQPPSRSTLPVSGLSETQFNDLKLIDWAERRLRATQQ